MNIIDQLTTPGNFIFTPKGAIACIRTFNATTNEVEVSVGAIGFVEAMAKATGSLDSFMADMRANGTLRSYHFDKLRVAPDLNDAK